MLLVAASLLAACGGGSGGGNPVPSVADGGSQSVAAPPAPEVHATSAPVSSPAPSSAPASAASQGRPSEVLRAALLRLQDAHSVAYRSQTSGHLGPVGASSTAVTIYDADRNRYRTELTITNPGQPAVVVTTVGDQSVVYTQMKHWIGKAQGRWIKATRDDMLARGVDLGESALGFPLLDVFLSAAARAQTSDENGFRYAVRVSARDVLASPSVPGFLRSMQAAATGPASDYAVTFHFALDADGNVARVLANVDDLVYTFLRPTLDKQGKSSSKDVAMTYRADLLWTNAHADLPMPDPSLVMTRKQADAWLMPAGQQSR